MGRQQIHSFRYKNVLYAVISLLLAFLTSAGFLLGIYMLTEVTSKNEPLINTTIEEQLLNTAILSNRDYH